MRMVVPKPVWLIVLVQALLKATCENCPDETLSGLVWPLTTEGQNISIACPPNEDGEAIRECGKDGVWGPVNYTGCTLRALEDLYRQARNASTIVAGNLTTVVTDLLALCTVSVAYSGQLATAVDTLLVLLTKDGLTELPRAEADAYIKNILRTADVLISPAGSNASWANIHAYKDEELFITFLEGLESFGNAVTLYLDTTRQETLTLRTTSNFQSTYQVVYGDADYVYEFTDPVGKVTIPSSALVKQDPSRNTGIATLVFRHSVSSLLPSSADNSRVLIDPGAISSSLVSCSLFPAPPAKLDSYVTILMQNDVALPNSTCAYLKYNDPKRVWEEDLQNCLKPTLNEDGTALCQCKHLTTFAIIGNPNTRGHLPNIVLASIVLYMVVIAVTFCLLLYANRKFDSDRASIVLCFLATLFTGHLTLLVGLYAIDNKDACRAVALLLHYFQMSYSFWMLAQAVQLVLKVTYKTTEPGAVAQFLALGWITPLFVVAGTAGLYVDHYGRGNYCALPLGAGISYALIVPVALVGITNFVCLFYSFYCFHVIKKTDKKCLVHMNRILPNVRACLMVLPLEIFEWIFSSLSIEFEHVVFDVLWILSALTMCILILLFYGIGSSEVVEEYEAHFGPCCWQHKKSSAVCDSPRPGWKDEVSQVSQYREASSIVRDVDSAPTPTGNGTTPTGGQGTPVAGCSGLNNGGLEVEDMLSRGKELNDATTTGGGGGGHGGGGAGNLAASLSSSFMLKTKLKVFPNRKAQQAEQPTASARPGQDNHR